MYRKTINREVQISGVGIHTGSRIDISLKPSPSGKIKFYRTDLNNKEISLYPENIVARNSTVLIEKETKIQTIEHLMAVLFMFGIDSLIIEINGCEIPAMDGSALPFVNIVQKAGIRTLSKRKKRMKILKSFEIKEKNASISFCPDSEFKVSYLIQYDHPAIQKQELSLWVNKKNFISDIAPARTFGFKKDVHTLWDKGLALGGSLKNTVVLDENGVMNGPLRFSDEFVRHKLLDLIGDLSLLGTPISGQFKAHCTGHKLHLEAVTFLRNNPEFWMYIE